MRMLERNARVATQLRRRLRRIDRRRLGRRRQRLVLLRQRRAGAQGRRRDEAARGDHVWWDRHDWSAARVDPGGRRLLPRAVRRRLRRQALAAEDRVHAAQPAPPATRSRTCSRASSSSASEGCLLCSQYNESLRVVVGPYDTLGRRPGRGAARRARRGERRLRALHRRRPAPRAARPGGPRRAHAPAPAPA